MYYVTIAALFLLSIVVKHAEFNEQCRSHIMSAVGSLLLYRQKTWVSGRMTRTITSMERIAREHVNSYKSAERGLLCTNSVNNARNAKSGGIDVLRSAASDTTQDGIDEQLMPFPSNTSPVLEGIEPAARMAMTAVEPIEPSSPFLRSHQRLDVDTPARTLTTPTTLMKNSAAHRSQTQFGANQLAGGPMPTAENSARPQNPDPPCQPSQMSGLQSPTWAMSDLDFERELGSEHQDPSTSAWLDSFDSDLNLHFWDTTGFC